MRWLDAFLAVSWFTAAGDPSSQLPADTVAADAVFGVVAPMVQPPVADTTQTPATAADTAFADSARVPDADGTNGETPAAIDGCPLGPHRNTARAVAGGVFVGANLELFRRFKNAWWSGEKADEFFFRADWDQEFRDQDKFGHTWGGYHLTRAGHTLLRGACESNRKAVFYSALYATLFQLQIAIWDGMYAKYGFSYPDLLANTVGMGFAVLHALEPSTQVVKPTISYRRTAAMKDQRLGQDEIRYSIDYSGQTYWLSLDVDAVLPPAAARWWPGIIRASVGHSITDWILPRPPGAPEGTGQEVVRAQRRILLSLDLDADKLPGNNPVWVFIKRQIGFIRLPAPALQLTPEVDLLRWYR